MLSRQTLSSVLTVNFAGGMGLTFGIYWSGGVSGQCYRKPNTEYRIQNTESVLSMNNIEVCLSAAYAFLQVTLKTTT